MNATSSEKEVHERIVDWIQLVTGLTTIKNHQGGGRPSGSYIMLNFLRGPIDVRFLPAATEYRGTGENNSEGNEQIEAVPVIESEWVFSINSMRGDDVMAPIRKLRSRAKIQGPQLGLDPLLSIHKIGEPRNLPEKINHEYEERGHAMIHIRGYTRDGFLIDVIDNAPVNMTRT